MSNNDLRPKAVVFDIGNVLIRWHPEDHFDRWFGRSRRRAMFAAVDPHEINHRMDAGEDFHTLVQEKAAKHPEYKHEIEMWLDRWKELAGPAIDLSVATLFALKRRGMPVFALSNFGVTSFALSEQEHAFLSAFDKRYISGHLKTVKPDHRIYEILEGDCGIAPDRLLFTDDLPANIATADKRGWQTHLFETPRRWADHLIAAGLIEEHDL
ncbi:HAD family phosphatase [Aliiroseovarius sp. KMU-50]|uniref:HAD family phosphatase n=1 Tax=Aliiroseovarius salicola TaxID=3009082 RepID=A0ABT4W6C7_9RHOB|nr:HAD family phosphatase [Aliiroseovarius sp. KMU-50]MDA5095417.1 HAD family phosphatase [Aliiroseovarius sp. KMU-50]